MKKLGKSLLFVSFCFFLANCKVPDEMTLNSNDIVIISKGEYQYIYPLSVKNGKVMEYDTFVVTIDTTFKVGDSTYFKGSTHRTFTLNPLGPVKFPMTIWKTENEIFLKTQPDYLSNEGNMYGNFWFKFPVVEKSEYSDGKYLEYRYYSYFWESLSKYKLDGVNFADQWFFNCRADGANGNPQFRYNYTIGISPRNFITSFNSCITTNPDCSQIITQLIKIVPK